jgi:TonB family protein
VAENLATFVSESRYAMHHRIWPVVIAVICFAVALPFLFAGASDSTAKPQEKSLEARENHAWKALRRNAQFSDIPHLSPSRCEDAEPPQALTTPDPLLIRVDRVRTVKVSFIIGTDGRVHSPLILESAGPRGDRNVLQTVRTWRYRPATCNGVPTEIEGKIEFSVR